MRDFSTILMTSLFVLFSLIVLLSAASTPDRTSSTLDNDQQESRILDSVSFSKDRLHRSKESLAYARARREFPALLSAAEAHFGSWVGLCMPLGSTRICILYITSGGNGKRAIKETPAKL